MFPAPDLRRLSPEEFAFFGFFQHSYIKAERVDGRTRFAIHAANGSLLCRAPDLETARLIVTLQLQTETHYLQ